MDIIYENSVEFRSENNIIENEVNEVNFEVLHPENSLMIQFQNTLKNLLENKLRNINTDLRISENGIKAVKNEYSNLAENLHIQKSEISRQENLISEYNESVSNLITKSGNLKNELNRAKENYDKEFSLFRINEKQNAELKNYIEVQNHRLQQLKNCEQDEKSNLIIIQKLISRNKREKNAELKKQQQQDYLLLKSENEVFKFELLIENYKKQIKSKCHELSLLQNTIVKKNTDIKIILQENETTMKFWEHVILIISNRDQKYANFKLIQEKIETDYKSKQIELNSYKRNAEIEIFKNEMIVVSRNKKQSYLDQMKQGYIEVLDKKRITEEELTNVYKMIESTEKHLKYDLENQLDLNHKLSTLEIKLAKLHNRKYQLEETYVTQLQKEMISNSASSQLNSEIKKLRDHLLNYELLIKEITQNSSDSQEILQNDEKLFNFDVMCLESLKNEIKVEEKEASNYEDKLNKIKLQIKQQNSTLDHENKQLYLLQEKPTLCSDLSEKIERYNENVKSMVNNINSEKRQWIRKQQEIMLLTKKKSKLLIDLNYTQKYVNVLQQKIFIVDQDIKKASQKNVCYDKCVSFQLKQIAKFNNQYNSYKNHGDALANENFVIQNNVLEKLKNAENTITKMGFEIELLQNTKESLEQEWLKLQEESFVWEKNVKLADEMRQNIVKEQNENGDAGRMKIEIHRMEIRYTQLKKVRDSLLSDLKTSLFKRDNILNQASIKERKQSEISQNQQHHMLMIKLENMKNRNIKFEKKIENFENEYFILHNRKNENIVNIKNYEETTIMVNHKIEELREKVQILSFSKQKNLEILIRQQRLADFFYRFKSGSIKTIFRNEIVIERDYLKHHNLNSDLIQILRTLSSTDFSESIPKNQFIRLLNIAESLSA